jgi:hypothetical protein
VLAYPAGSNVSTVVAAGFYGPCQIRLDGRGNLFVASVVSGTIQMFCLASGNTTGTTVVSGLSGAGDVAFDSSFNLYALDLSTSSVLMFAKL